MNDDPAMALLYLELHRAMCSSGYRVSFPELLEEREELIRRHGPEHWQMLGRKYLGEQGHWRLMLRCAGRMRADYMASHAVMPGMADAVRLLSERYEIGVVANQLRESGDALDGVGMGRHIKVRAISEAIGHRKPSPEIYLWALERAGCDPGEAVMVGDRLDNDIAPARRLGIWTILCRVPHDRRGYEAKDETERLYFASQRRASISRLDPSGPDQTPDETAASAEELLLAIERIAHRAAAASGEAEGRR
ncbi:MAG: HAD family hydrolase [Candidatus Eisenbacteria bacterium]|nr:HAD family hydrolase [Candidatus Eisenbacteria bacterium]